MSHVRFIGLDVHKKKIAVAIAEEGRNGEVLSYGSIDNTPEALTKLLKKLRRDDATLHLCYEAGGCGYGVYRQIVEAGHICDVIAPSLIPRPTGDRVKTDRRDAAVFAEKATKLLTPASNLLRSLITAKKSPVVG